DLTQGRDPLDRIKPPPATQAETASQDNGPAPAAADEASSPAAASSPDALKPALDGAGDPLDHIGQTRPGEPAHLPALINLLVPAGTLLGWSTAPGEAAGWGLLDTEETGALVKAASRHPRTRWCVTVAQDGTAMAHGCATGQHPWLGNAPPASGSPPQARSSPGSPSQRAPDTRHGTTDATPEQAAQLLGLLRRLNVTLEPVARDTCDHGTAENQYVPSRKLKHLVRARNQLCTAPACNAQALYCDLDHTVPYPDGPTDQCNLSPKCRRHHRTKQAPGWKVTQPAPGTTIWTTPSGRTHTTTSTAYDL
ncbi:MAG: HNH endonuclease signature motif containing protein, partial [Trebonia sp.]